MIRGFFAAAAGAQGASAPARLLSSYSSRHVPVDGGGDVMDEPGVPVLVRLQVRGQRMTVWALLRGEGLVLGLFHGVHLLEGKGSASPPWHEPDPLVHRPASNDVATQVCSIWSMRSILVITCRACRRQRSSSSRRLGEKSTGKGITNSTTRVMRTLL